MQEMRRAQHPATVHNDSSANLEADLNANEWETEHKKQLLREVFDTQGGALLKMLAVHISRAGTAGAGVGHSHRVRELALDALTDLFDEAMNCAHKYDPSRLPLPWLFQISHFVVLRQRDHLFRDRKRALERETSCSDLPRGEDDNDIEDVFDRLTAHAAHALHSPMESRAALQNLLEPLNADERDIIARCVLCKLDSATVAQQLKIEPATARKRLQRALDKLRKHACNHKPDASHLNDSVSTRVESSTSRKSPETQTAQNHSTSFRRASGQIEVKADA